MEKICGDGTVVVVNEAAKTGVERFVFVSAAGAGQTGHKILRGYWQGKQKAEEAVLRRFPDGGVILRASGVYGNRQVGPVMVPLGVVMRPMELALQLPPFPTLRRSLGPLEAIFTPPVAVDAVGKTAAAAATGALVPPGVLEVEDIKRYAALVG
ncbi:unnamed protein product [Phaeothamnion confervicola]